MNKSELKERFLKKYDFRIPEWWDCQWRREPCSQPSCPFCGRLMKQRFKHQFKGEDPDSLESALQDVEDSFAETRMMIAEDADKLGIDLNNIPDEEYESPPGPLEFHLEKKYHEWLARLHHFAMRTPGEWLETEAGLDLMWYAPLISAKIYRSLCSRWRVRRGQSEDDLDYDYTKYVIENCVAILKTSFEALIGMHLHELNGLIDLYHQLLNLEKEIISI